MARWLLACALLIGVPAMMLTAPVVGDGAGTAAAVAVVAVLVLASVVLLCGLSTGPKAAGPPVRTGADGEDRHRRGAFRRQSAPDTPGRPARPRAPGLALTGGAR